jgi:hypothetical protein
MALKTRRTHDGATSTSSVNGLANDASAPGAFAIWSMFSPNAPETAGIFIVGYRFWTARIVSIPSVQASRDLSPTGRKDWRA